jgi:hypothetical protein
MDDPQAHWKAMGHQWEVAAEFLLKRMGYRILRAQHRDVEVKRERCLRNLHKDKDLDWYLWKYTDYIVERRSAIRLVDVKSKPLLYLLGSGSRWGTYGNGSVSFTRMEMRAYPGSRISVHVLVIRYRDKDDPRRLGPVEFSIIPFDQFEFKPDWAGGFPPASARWKTLSSSAAYSMLPKTPKSLGG